MNIEILKYQMKTHLYQVETSAVRRSIDETMPE